MTEPLLQAASVSKSYGRQCVLSEVSFDVRAGEVHVLAGENGAGKTTLIKVLSGAVQPDGGHVCVRGQRVRLRNPCEAANLGVGVIHQELSLVPSMSIADNLFLGHEQATRGWLKTAGAHKRASALLAQLGLHIDVRRTVAGLPIAAQQLVEVGKALALDARVIIMDEPTSALSEPEVARLFARIDDLKGRGCGVVYITHRLDEIYKLADRITVLRDGQRIVTCEAGELPAPDLIRAMVGRSIAEQSPRAAHASDATRLRVTDCTVRASGKGRQPVVRGVSFGVGRGEILGIFGLHGSGVSELLQGVFGALGGRTSVRVKIDGRETRIRNPRDAIRNGIALVTSDRKQSGLVLSMDVVENTTLASLSHMTPGGWIRHGRERQSAAQAVAPLHLRAASLRQEVRTLSGGNQQKVVLAKWLLTRPRILMLDEPTRGVDVGAKHEIYLLMKEWSAQGHAIVFSSSELPELLQVSNRILVMRRGAVAASFDSANACQEELLHAAMGDAVHV